jgi:hypothetical protein
VDGEKHNAAASKTIEQPRKVIGTACQAGEVRNNDRPYSAIINRRKEPSKAGTAKIVGGFTSLFDDADEA